jgi:hypothetical protein
MDLRDLQDHKVLKGLKASKDFKVYRDHKVLAQLQVQARSILSLSL